MKLSTNMIVLLVVVALILMKKKSPVTTLDETPAIDLGRV